MHLQYHENENIQNQHDQLIIQMQLMNKVKLEQAINDFHFVKQENVIQGYHD
jgi:hypothetical protein